MIICHQHRFIFLKTSKTAGTSIEIALSKFCGDGDIITPISKPDEMIRRDLGYPGPQNYAAPFWEYNVKDLFRLIVKNRKKKRYYNHIPAERVRQSIPAEIWDTYYKFCFVRNPWDRLVSYYYWFHKGKDRPTFSEYIKSEVPLTLIKRGYEIYTIDDEVVVDGVYRYEDLEAAIEDLSVRLNLPSVPVLPNAKSSHRTDKRHYREVYTEEEREKVAKLFAKEIQLFQYSF